MGDNPKWFTISFAVCVIGMVLGLSAMLAISITDHQPIVTFNMVWLLPIDFIFLAIVLVIRARDV